MNPRCRGKKHLHSLPNKNVLYEKFQPRFFPAITEVSVAFAREFKGSSDVLLFFSGRKEVPYAKKLQSPGLLLYTLPFFWRKNSDPYIYGGFFSPRIFAFCAR